MPKKSNRRRNGIIDKLNVDLRDAVDQMLLSGAPYREIVEFLGDEGVTLSRQAVCNYARRFLATTQMLRIAQDNFRILTEEIDKNLELDTAEGIIRVMSNQMLNTLANAKPEEWSGVEMDKLLREANSLIRVTAHKRRVDTMNRNELDKALAENKNLLFSVLAKKHPNLYSQLTTALYEIQEDDLNGV